jgi:hypothetical protein
MLNKLIYNLQFNLTPIDIPIIFAIYSTIIAF